MLAVRRREVLKHPAYQQTREKAFREADCTAATWRRASGWTTRAAPESEEGLGPTCSVRKLHQLYR